MSVKRNINCKIYFHPCLIFRSWVSPRPVSLPPFPWSRNASRVWLRRLTSRGHSTQPTNIHTWLRTNKAHIQTPPKITIYINNKKNILREKSQKNVIKYSRDYCLVSEKMSIPGWSPDATTSEFPPEWDFFTYKVILFTNNTWFWVLIIKTRSFKA